MTARLHHLLPPLLLMLFAAIPAPAQRRNSISSPKLRPAGSAASPAQRNAAPYDTVPFRPGMVVFSGYDKTLRASKETVFVTSHMADSTVEALWFTITYLDTAGRELHRRSRRICVTLPPGATRRIDFPSWDVQRSFYYAGSPPARTSAIPYTVTITPDTLLIAP